MRIAVTDANIFIDLFHLKYIGHLCNINCEIYTTQLVILELEEMHAEQLYELMTGGNLFIERLTEKDEYRLQKLESLKGLSESDRSVLCIAQRLKAIVLSGDDLVRKTCDKLKIEKHGILWCLDQFVIHNHITKKLACESLQKLMGFNKRLPYKDCKEYIEEKWGGKFPDSKE